MADLIGLTHKQRMILREAIENTHRVHDEYCSTTELGHICFKEIEEIEEWLKEDEERHIVEC